MAKRFYNTSRIEEDWYINLSCKHRELLRYCESKCDGAGIFSWSAKIASIYLGEKIVDSDLDILPVSKLPTGKFFIHGFCFFQNGELSEKSPAHNSVFKSIKENGITESVLFGRVVNRLQSSQQEEEREIVKEELKERAIEEERSVDKFKENFDNDYKTDEKVCRENGFNESQLQKAKFEFWNTKELDSEMLGKSFQDVQKHFINWCRQNKSRLKETQNGTRKGHNIEASLDLADRILSGQYTEINNGGNTGKQ